MNTHGLFLLFALTLLDASAEVRRSSRNLEPLTRRAESADASNRVAKSQAPAADAPAGGEGTRVAFLGPKSGWGFVQQESPHYSPDGKNLGSLPGGTLFRYSDVKSSSKNNVLVCTVKRGGAWEGPFLLDCADVAAYEGALETQDPETVRQLAEYFTLNGRVAARQAALAEEALARNPHFESAKQARDAYLESLEKAAEMERQMNTLTGARKAKADEALRAFKYEQVRVKARADQAAADYAEWKRAHPPDTAKAAADPQLKALEAERRTAAAKVSHLLPQP